MNPVPAAVVKVTGRLPPGDMLPLVALAFSVRLGFATESVRIWVWVMLPLVPVTPMTEVPTTALAATLIVSVLCLPPAGMTAGEKLAVMPAGNPLAERVTAELNPLTPATARLKGADPPTLTLAPVGFVVSVKVWAETVMVNSNVRLKPPPVPVTTTGKVPAAAPEVAATVIVTGPEAVVVGEEKEMVMPFGAPAADSVTGELNPPCTVMLIVAGVELPGGTVRVETRELSEKFEAIAFRQLLTSRKASTDPRPVVMSYPVAAL